MTKDAISQRYAQLASEASKLPIRESFDTLSMAEVTRWRQWASSTQNLISVSFGEDSNFFSMLDNVIKGEEIHGVPYSASAALGVFLGAKEDFAAGFATTLEQTISGDIFGDILGLATAALEEGYKDSAAVLAAAAFEDSLKKIGTLKKLTFADKGLSEVVNALKANQILKGGAGKTAEHFVKFRNFALHANWDKITAEEVRSLIGFVREVLVQHLS
jgi:hypothetical protein